MIAHVVENVLRCSALDRLIVATDDARIADAARRAGAEAAIVDGAFATGSDRVAAVARDLEADVVVNVQGDEPLLPPAHVDALVAPFLEGDDVEMATLASRFSRWEDVASPRTAKVVADDLGRALYFSRTPIPFCYRPADPSAEGRAPLSSYLRHIGIYAYRASFLQTLAAAPASALELSEGLEQLRALSLGARIRVVEVEHATVGVDTPEDLLEVERLLSEQVEIAAPTAARG